MDDKYFDSLKQNVILAESGDEATLHWLWLKLDKGIDIYSTSEWEYRWYHIMATNPNYCDTYAMMLLNELFMKGIYVNKDENEAIYWLNKAANLGDTDALRERINYNFVHNNLDKIIEDYKFLLTVYLRINIPIELAKEASFRGIDNECIDYIIQNIGDLWIMKK